MSNLRIYVHIPFCVSRCPYCDFVSFAIRDEELYQKYVGAVCREAEIRKEEFRGMRVISIYFGGGTPSIFPAYLLENLLDCITKNFPHIHRHSEITIEVNPATVERENFAVYKKAGFNRVSIGVQSLDDAVLRFLGRIHSAKNALDSLEEAVKFFENVSADLIWGVMDDSDKRILSDLSEFVKMGVSHLSTYLLTLEEEVPLYKRWIGGEFKLPEEEVLEKWYYLISDFLESKGFIHYEISNFARKGKFSVHNWGYWIRDPYLGLGVAAHSFNIEKNRRCENYRELRKYFSAVNEGKYPFEMSENLDENEAIFEKVWLSLRTNSGISEELLSEIAGKEKVKELIWSGLLKRRGKRIIVHPGKWFQQEAIIKALT